MSKLNSGIKFVYSGTVINPTQDHQLEILENQLLGVDAEGQILFLEDQSQQVQLQKEFQFNDQDIRRLEQGSFLIPGFVDTHIHACQYSNAGLGLDLALLEWLNTYTFPTESKFVDLELAKNIYRKVVARTLINGTTSAQYMATLHVPASILLSEITLLLGQRAFIGKVSMDQNCPDYYTETTTTSLADTEKFVKAVLSKNDALVKPVITPRFAVSCTSTLMEGLAKLAEQHQLRVQTHVSENQKEVEFVREIFPLCSSYCDVYNQAGLFTNKTVLAHGVHLSDSELQLLAEKGVHISHCANSNCSLRSGMCNVRRLLDAGINVGLGTDVSGGYSPSIMDAMRQTITVSNLVSVQSENYPPLSYQEAFFLATLGGAKALGLESTLGSLKPGKTFDALHINLKGPNSPVDLTEDLSSKELFQKFIFSGDDRNILQVFVQGKEVKTEATRFLNV